MTTLDLTDSKYKDPTRTEFHVPLRWDKQSDYERYNDAKKPLTIRQWAWEFLRRSRRYRLAYDDVVNQAAVSFENRKELMLDPQRARREFLINDFINPNVPCWIHTPTFVGLWNYFVPNIDGQFPPLGESELLIRVDLSLPWKPQVATIEKYFAAHQEYWIKKGNTVSFMHDFRPTTFSQYIRILDARLVTKSKRATFKTISIELGETNEKYASKASNKAKLIADHEYEFLLLMEPHLFG